MYSSSSEPRISEWGLQSIKVQVRELSNSNHCLFPHLPPKSIDISVSSLKLWILPLRQYHCKPPLSLVCSPTTRLHPLQIHSPLQESPSLQHSPLSRTVPTAFKSQQPRSSLWDFCTLGSQHLPSPPGSAVCYTPNTTPAILGLQATFKSKGTVSTIVHLWCQPKTEFQW